MYRPRKSKRPEFVFFVIAANLGQYILECLITYNVLFSEHVPLKIRLGVNVDHRWLKPLAKVERGTSG